MGHKTVYLASDPDEDLHRLANNVDSELERSPQATLDCLPDVAKELGNCRCGILEPVTRLVYGAARRINLKRDRVQFADRLGVGNELLAECRVCSLDEGTKLSQYRGRSGEIGLSAGTEADLPSVSGLRSSEGVGGGVLGELLNDTLSGMYGNVNLFGVGIGVG